MFHLPLLARNLQAAERDLRHRDIKVRVEAVRDLRLPGEEGQRSQRIALLESALTDEAPLVRKEALLSLADQKAEESLKRIAVLLADSDPSVRSFAVLALGEIAPVGHAEVAGRIYGLLRAGDPAVRFQALIAHVRLSPQDAQETLFSALRDADAKLRSLALRLLEEHWLSDSASHLDEKRLQRELERVSRDEAPVVRLVAQLMGAQLGFTVPTDALVDVVNQKWRGEEPRDEQLAIELAGRLRLQEARPGLTRRALGRFRWGSWDPFRFQARAALACLGHPRALQLVERSLLRGSWQERHVMVFSVGQVGLTQFREQLLAWQGQEDQMDQEVLREALRRLDEA